MKEMVDANDKRKKSTWCASNVSECEMIQTTKQREIVMCLGRSLYEWVILIQVLHYSMSNVANEASNPCASWTEQH